MVPFEGVRPSRELGANPEARRGYPGVALSAVAAQSRAAAALEPDRLTSGFPGGGGTDGPAFQRGPGGPALWCS